MSCGCELWSLQVHASSRRPSLGQRIMQIQEQSPSSTTAIPLSLFFNRIVCSRKLPNSFTMSTKQRNAFRVVIGEIRSSKYTRSSEQLRFPIREQDQAICWVLNSKSSDDVIESFFVRGTSWITVKWWSLYNGMECCFSSVTNLH